MNTIRARTTADIPTNFSQRGTTGRNILMSALIACVVGGVGASAYFYQKYETLKKNPQAISTAETSKLTGIVGKLMTLPTGENPTVATVSDKAKLASQPFFKNASNGDKLLIYTNAKQAIIYRPVSNKIINVGPIAIDTAAAAATSTTAKTKK